MKHIDSLYVIVVTVVVGVGFSSAVAVPLRFDRQRVGVGGGLDSTFSSSFFCVASPNSLRGWDCDLL